MITAIACVFERDGISYIGMDNDLLFDIRADKRFFRNYIKNSVLICGYNTYKTLPKSIIESHVVLVLTKSHYNEFEDIDKDHFWKFQSDRPKVLAYKDIEDIVDLSNFYGHKRFVVIGGGEIYELFDPYIKTWHLTIIYESKYTMEELVLNNAVKIPPILHRTSYKCISYMLNNQIEYDNKTEDNVEINIFTFYPLKLDPMDIYFEQERVRNIINDYVR